MARPIYLDFAAATPIDKKVMAAMRPYLEQDFYNPSATYLAAKQVHKDIEEARGRIADRFGARPSEIIFTAGGTEANNLAIHGVMQAFPGKKILYSAIEHEAVRMPAGQYDATEIPVKADGVIDLGAMEKLIDDNTVLVSVMYANNEIGTIEPLRDIAEVIKSTARSRMLKNNDLPLYLHTDACQAANYLDLHADRVGVDMMTINGGKIYGPKQTGALYVKTGTRLNPQVLGGGQELNRRSGTENVAGIIGFAAALDIAQTQRQAEVERLQQLSDGFITDLKQAIPDIEINGSLKRRLPNNIHVTIPGIDNERLLMALDEQGIMCAAGSACSASKEEASHVLKAIGRSEQEAYASLRFSLGRPTTASELKQVAETLPELI